LSMPSSLMLLTYPYRPDPRVFREARAMARHGFKIHLIAWDRDSGRRHQVDENGVDVVRVGPRCPYRSVRSIMLRLPRYWFNALRESRRMDFDIVHCHDFDTLPLGMMLSKLRSRPVLYDAHEIYSDMIGKDAPGVSQFVWTCEKWMSGRAEELVTVNEALAAKLSKDRATPARIVRNSPDIGILDGAEAKPIKERYNLRGFVISYLGSLEPGRFVPELVSSSEPSGEITLAIAGNGTLRPLVEKAASTNHSIRFLGTLDTDEALRVTWASDLVVAMLDPSNRNYRASTPVKVLDAMACGRPVVTSEGLDISNVVDSVGCGFVIPYEIRAFRKTVEHAIASPKVLDEMGQKGREYFEKELSWEHSEEELLRAYRELAGQS
jgi:glycosyltransferase involved in cell wall biosynthesis